jgi:hypothetical protein
MATFTACIAKKPMPQDEELAPIKTIVVLPAEISTSSESKRTEQTTKSLVQGQEALNTLLNEYFADKENIRVLTEGQRDTMEKNFTRCRTTDAVTICNIYNADAVLICTLHRYDERQGTEYSVIKPASVAFDLKLVMAKNGKTLWAGSFNKTQQHMLTDIFKFLEKAKRGFKWITAQALAKEGLHQKLNKCRYFNK